MAARFFLMLLILGVALAGLAGLALPLRHDDAWLAGALAGAGVAAVWLGLWRRWTALRRAGLLLQACAWLAFIAATNELDLAAAQQARLWLGALTLAASALALAITFHTRPAHPAIDRMPLLALIFLAAAALWLLTAAWTEIVLRSEGIAQLNLFTVSALGIAALFAILARRLQWREASHAALTLQFVAAAAWLYLLRSRWMAQPPGLLDGPFPSAAMLGAGLFLCNRFLGRQSKAAPTPLLTGLLGFVLPWIGLCWFALALGLLSHWATIAYAAPAPDPLPDATNEAMNTATPAAPAVRQGELQ